MPDSTKIKITDNIALRSEIEKIASSLNQVDLSGWAVKCAMHVMHYSYIEFPSDKTIADGFQILESWQKGEATIHQVRKAGFKIHSVARECKTETAKAALRCAGQAVSTGHMREHAMICSDYAIKAIQLAFPGCVNKITDEREWQLTQLKCFVL